MEEEQEYDLSSIAGYSMSFSTCVPVHMIFFSFRFIREYTTKKEEHQLSSRLFSLLLMTRDTNIFFMRLNITG
jgi:hypothetical protein